MARARIEPAAGWDPARLLIVQLERLGYTVDDERSFGPDGPVSVLLIS